MYLTRVRYQSHILVSNISFKRIEQAHPYHAEEPVQRLRDEQNVLFPLFINNTIPIYQAASPRDLEDSGISKLCATFQLIKSQFQCLHCSFRHHRQILQHRTSHHLLYHHNLQPVLDVLRLHLTINIFGFSSAAFLQAWLPQWLFRMLWQTTFLEIKSIAFAILLRTDTFLFTLVKFFSFSLD